MSVGSGEGFYVFIFLCLTEPYLSFKAAFTVGFESNTLTLCATVNTRFDLGPPRGTQSPPNDQNAKGFFIFIFLMGQESRLFLQCGFLGF